MHYALIVKLQSVPLLQNIENCNREGEPHLDIFKHSLPQSFEITHLSQQRKNGFDYHSLVSLPALTNFHICWIFLFRAEAFVHINNHSLVKPLDQAVKRAVRNICCCRLIRTDESEFIGDDAKFAADNPAPVAQAFSGKSFFVWLTAFTNRMTQLNPETIGNAKKSSLCQKNIGQSEMRFQAAEKPRAFGQNRKQMRKVLPQPTIKAVLRSAFQSKQQTNCHQLAFAQFGSRILSFARHFVIYAAKQVYDKFFLSHVFNLPCVVFGHLHNRKKIVTFSISTKGYITKNGKTLHTLKSIFFFRQTALF